VELDYYLFKSKRTQKEFAEKIDMLPHSLSFIVNGKKAPNLYHAMQIHYESGGKVTLFDLLKPDEKEKLDKKYGILKKECVYRKDMPTEEDNASG
jgi:transcriptional regulator with XRE-family HTH domain